MALLSIPKAVIPKVVIPKVMIKAVDILKYVTGDGYLDNLL